MLLKRLLFRDVNCDDFIAMKISILVKDASAAEPGFQSRAVFPLPFDFDRFDLQSLEESPSQWFSLTNIEDDLRCAGRRQQLFFDFVAQHRQESLVDVEKLSFRIAPAYSVSGIVHQRAIQRLRMPQGLSSLFQLRAQFLFVYDSANGHGQLSEMLPLNVIERTMSG